MVINRSRYWQIKKSNTVNNNLHCNGFQSKLSCNIVYANIMPGTTETTRRKGTYASAREAPCNSPCSQTKYILTSPKRPGLLFNWVIEGYRLLRKKTSPLGGRRKITQIKKCKSRRRGLSAGRRAVRETRGFNQCPVKLRGIAPARRPTDRKREQLKPL